VCVCVCILLYSEKAVEQVEKEIFEETRLMTDNGGNPPLGIVDYYYHLHSEKQWNERIDAAVKTALKEIVVRATEETTAALAAAEAAAVAAVAALEVKQDITASVNRGGVKRKSPPVLLPDATNEIVSQPQLQPSRSDLEPLAMSRQHQQQQQQQQQQEQNDSKVVPENVIQMESDPSVVDSVSQEQLMSKKKRRKAAPASAVLATPATSGEMTINPFAQAATIPSTSGLLSTAVQRSTAKGEATGNETQVSPTSKNSKSPQYIKWSVKNEEQYPELFRVFYGTLQSLNTELQLLNTEDGEKQVSISCKALRTEFIASWKRAHPDKPVVLCADRDLKMFCEEYNNKSEHNYDNPDHSKVFLRWKPTRKGVVYEFKNTNE
jgi:hypothetical protein